MRNNESYEYLAVVLSILAVRLVGVSDRKERAEVYYNGTWGTYVMITGTLRMLVLSANSLASKMQRLPI